MARGVGDSGRAVVLDAAQIKRLIRIAGTTGHSERDQTVVVLSYWLGLRAKELASLRVGVKRGAIMGHRNDCEMQL